MTLEEFEAQSQIKLEEMLNHLQIVSLLMIQASEKVEAAGQSAQSLGQLIEEFIVQQKSHSS